TTSSPDSTTTVTDSDAAAAPTIAGTVAGQTTTSETPIAPFKTVTITDLNDGGADNNTLTITYSGAGTLADGASFTGTHSLSGSSGDYTLSGTAAAITSELDKLVFTPVDGVPNTSVKTTFTLSDKNTVTATTSSPDSTTTVTDSDAAAAPTIAGTVAGQTTTSETPIAPFKTVTITDLNDGGADNNTLTITYSGAGTLADGASFTGTHSLSGSSGDYTLSGTAAAITSELDKLVFTPVDGVPNTSVKTTFTLSDKNTVTATTSSPDSTTTVTDSDAAAAPTIAGTVAGQTTTSETPIAPFKTVTITDLNDGGADNNTLTITYSGAGTLADGASFTGTHSLSGSSGDYTLSGTAAAITSELDKLVFTPVDGVPNTSVKTTFTLSDKNTVTATTSSPDSTTTVTDSDAAAAPTIAGTVAGQTTTSETPIAPFKTVTITDLNDGGADNNTLTITYSGAGTLADGASFTGTHSLIGSSRDYRLSGTAAAITSELDKLVFTPVDGVPNTSVKTTFTLSDKNTVTATTSSPDSTTTVTDSDAAAAPTIAGTVAGQTTTSETPIAPFKTVTITDLNDGGADNNTLTITYSGAGTLADGASFTGTHSLSGSSGDYTLSGTAAAITSELDKLVFTPVDGVPNTSVKTTFTLSDKNTVTATTSSPDSTTTVTDS